MTLDEFSELYIKPAMKNLANMSPEELIAAAERDPAFAEFYDYVLINLYGIDRRVSE